MQTVDLATYNSVMAHGLFHQSFTKNKEESSSYASIIIYLQFDKSFY